MPVLTDEEVGLSPQRGLSDADVGLTKLSDAEVGLSDKQAATVTISGMQLGGDAVLRSQMAEAKSAGVMEDLKLLALDFAIGATTPLTGSPAAAVGVVQRGVEGAASTVAGEPLVFAGGVNLEDAMRRPVLAIPQIEKSEGDLWAAQIAKGTANAVADFANFLQTPEMVSFLFTKKLPAPIQKAATLTIAGSMAAHAPEQFKAGLEAARAGDYQEAAKQIVGAGGATALSALVAKHGMEPPQAVKVGEPANLVAENLERNKAPQTAVEVKAEVSPEAAKPISIETVAEEAAQNKAPATALALKETENASNIQKAAEVHGDVRPLAVEGKEAVPAEVGREGIQPLQGSEQTQGMEGSPPGTPRDLLSRKEAGERGGEEVAPPTESVPIGSKPVEAPPDISQPKAAEGVRPLSEGPGAKSVGAAPESIAETAGSRTAEFIGSAKPVDIPISKTKAADVPMTEADLRSADPAVESRWQSAKLTQRSWLDKAKDALTRARNAMTRHFPKLDPKTDGVLTDILRNHENAPNWSKYTASQVMRGITDGLAPRKFDVFNRIVILRDLVKYGEKFLADKADLPFGYKSIDAIRTDLARFEAVAEKYPDIKQSIERRNEFMDALRDDLVKRELLPEAVKDYGEYFHHQVLEHMAMKESPVASTGSPDVRTHQKSWQRKRVGSSKDFNTSYLESEFEVISQSFAQMATQDALKRVKETADISPSLKAAAKAMKEEGKDVDWRRLVPDDYTLWQPERGNHFYWANSLTDRALESFLRGEKMLTEADFREVLAKGGPKEQWVIPKRLAETLDNFGPQKDHPVEKFIGAGLAQWKRWTLFNPMRNLIYQLNNLSGDFDISMAVDPRIFTKAPEAASRLRQFVMKGKAGTPELNTLIRRGVIDSGFSVHELPDLKGQQFFRALTGENPSLIGRYWETVLDYNRWREGVLRLAAYDRALERLKAGEKVYWTSKRPEIDAMMKDARVPLEDVAAKLAREAIGDYGNISHAGQWIRSKMIPFYSWMEINAPRYVRLFQNVRHEGGTGAGVVAIAGKRVVTKTAALAAKAGAFYLLANLWNKTFFPDEEKELGDTRDQFHLILGRDEDGSIRSVRLQGALTDALSWFGAENPIHDIEDVARGRASVGDKIVQAAKAPVNKVVNASFPIQKTLAEAVLERKTFPDVFNPRTVRDPAGHVARLFSMGTVYDYLTSKPQRQGTWSPLSLMTYTTDPGEAAYYASKSIVGEWLEKNGKEKPSMIPAARNNALYYYKQAIKFKDESAKKYWDEKYKSLGGTDAGKKTSIRSVAPLHGIASKELSKFKESLTPAEKEIIKKAEDWFKKTY